MNICKSDLYFIVLLCIILYLHFFCNNKKEHFQNTITGYQADVEAIRNLSNIASQLTSTNQLTLPGTINVTNSLTVSGNIKSTYGVIEGRALYASGGTQNNPNNWGTHFPFIGNGNNYIRGDTVVNGDILQDTRSYQTTSGNITAINGNIIATNGTITATNGNINATNGHINATNGIITGKNITATSGNITATSGNITATNGTITGKNIVVTDSITLNKSDAKPLINLGDGDPNKDLQSGIIAYGLYDASSINIIGKGSKDTPGNRITKMWDHVIVTNRFATNNLTPTQVPTGWNGIRTLDVYASGNIGLGGNDTITKTHLDNKGNARFDGNLTVSGNLNIAGFDIKRLRSMLKCAGYAVDISGTSILLFEGQNDITRNTVFNSWANDKWDCAYIYRGWEVHFYGDGDYNKLNPTASYLYTKNTDFDIPVKFDLPSNQVSAYMATWVGF